MKLRYIVLAGTAAISFGALAEGQHSQGQTSQRSQTEQQNVQQPMSQSSEVVRQAQTNLSAKGYDPGPIDGKLGPKTQSSIKKFQQDQQLQTSGTLDQPTMAALGVNESQAADPGTQRGSS